MQVRAAGILRGLSLPRQLEPGALGQVRHGIEKSKLLVLHQKAHHRAVRSAAETVIELLVRAHPEGRRFLAVEGAIRLVFAAGLLERHPRADDFDDVRACDDFVDEGLWNAPGHGPRAINRLSGL